MNATVFIYTLRDPNAGEVRYVGKTDNPRRRLRKHIREAQCYRENNHRSCWIRKVLSSGKEPVFDIIDEVPIEHWQQWEVAWIAYFKELGCDLTNGSLGGEGADPTDEVREKISKSTIGNKRGLGHRHSIKMKRHLSTTKTGARNPMFGKRGAACHHFGKPRTDDVKKKISATKWASRFRSWNIIASSIL